MRYLLISAAAAFALAGAATIGNAQAPDEKNKAPAAEGKAPGAPGPQREPAAGKTERPQQPPARGSEPKGKSGAERAPDKGQPRTTERAKDQPKSTQPQQGKEQPKNTERQQPGKDQQRSSQKGQPGSDQPKGAEGPKQGKDQRKAAEQRQQGQDEQKSTQGSDQKQGRVQVTEQQRGGVRERLVKEARVERTKINVSVNIGRSIPRSVRLHTLPVSIVSFAPAYRGYSYIVLEDETICIVDARTYVIVDIIPAGTQRADRPGRAHLALSSDQMRYIFTSVPKGRTADVRVRLALGAEVPRDVELIAFPSDVQMRVPELGRYRYVVAGGDVIIVDPSDNAVVLVINE